MNPYFRTPPVVKNLIIANLLVFLAMMLLEPVNNIAYTYCTLHWFTDSRFYAWQFITYMFVHGGMWHIFVNMFALWMFGRILEYEIGSKRFIIYYLVCGIGAGLIELGINALVGNYWVSLLGASGATMGLLLAFGVMHPNERIFIIPFPFPIKAKWLILGYVVYELLFGVINLFVGTGSVAHFAHFGGMLWGWLLLLYWKHRGRINY